VRLRRPTASGYLIIDADLIAARVSGGTAASKPLLVWGSWARVTSSAARLQ
jgi:hypothetical protein